MGKHSLLNVDSTKTKKNINTTLKFSSKTKEKAMTEVFINSDRIKQENEVLLLCIQILMNYENDLMYISNESIQTLN